MFWRAAMVSVWTVCALVSGAIASDAVLMVGNDRIAQSDIDAAWTRTFPGQDAPDFATLDTPLRDMILREVANRHLIVEAAKEAGVAQDPEFDVRLAAARKQILIQMYAEKHAKLATQEEVLKARYDALRTRRLQEDEVHARHLLLPSKEEAQAARKRLKKGEDFAVLAKALSKDTASAAKGGDLGYFRQEQMVPAFGKAAFALHKGGISQPVQTPFGWHIIEVLDRRKAEVPAFEAMRAKLARAAVEENVRTLLQQLQQGHALMYRTADGTSQPITWEGTSVHTDAETPEK